MVFATVTAAHSVHSGLLCKQHGAQNPFDLENPNQLWNYTCSSGTGGAVASGTGGALGVPVHSWGTVAGVSSTHAASVKGAFGVGKNGLIPNTGPSPFGASGARGWVTVGGNAAVANATAAANSAAAAAGTGVHAAVSAHTITNVPMAQPPPVHSISHVGGAAVRAVQSGTHAAVTVTQAPASAPTVVVVPPKGIPTGATYGSAGFGLKPHKWVSGSSVAKPNAAGHAPSKPVFAPSGVVVGMHGGVVDSNDNPVVNGPSTGFSSHIDQEIGVGNGFMN
uniref:Uncharacterized protein n=1 Tax=Hemiselmis tepida TaxID=464990 RepID=A0A7S0VW77_9CRYP|mmetsp:Transcript_30010/g.75992  ORF Transcript_30010/g.75992 Transcript_30010/m.75992 type:complete len:279 (+) Transcript_30010:74-910(+)